MASGKVILVGAGPGDPELLTLKAVHAIGAADVVIYDSLVSPEVLAFIRAQATRIDVGKRAGHHPVPQREINCMLVRLARSGRVVVRLKGGDPFVFGRGCEEVRELERAGIACEVVPGITAAQGCAASARVPLTHRGTAHSVRYVTGHCRADLPLDLDWAGLADPETTLVVYMGRANVEAIARNLISHGMPHDLPVLAVSRGTTRRERRLRTSLHALPAAIANARLESPVLFIIGHVAAMASESMGDAQRVAAEDLAVVA
jgi:uroporphyrin-III C-methyltransferase